MHHVDDPAYMTSEERATEVAAILARGILRLQKRNVRQNRQETAESRDVEPSHNFPELPCGATRVEP